MTNPPISLSLVTPRKHARASLRSYKKKIRCYPHFTLIMNLQSLGVSIDHDPPFTPLQICLSSP